MQASTIPATIAPALGQAIYRPSDAARDLGINEDSVTRHIKQRPKLFPAKNGSRHEWEPDQYPKVLNALCSLSHKARRKISQ